MKLSSLFTAYLTLIERTSTIEIRGTEYINDGFVAGFWHEDSFSMCLVLKKMAQCGHIVTSLVTEDSRGDVIEDIINSCQGQVFRMPYNSSLRSVLATLIQASKDHNANIAAALDGPLGPLHKAKKLLFLLAHSTDKKFVGVRLHYARKLRLTRRWDKYVIPLPFNTITVDIHDFGKVSRDQLTQFAAYRSEIEHSLLQPLENTSATYEPHTATSA